ncbi:winged helix-turn-helix domain-containing protein [Hydrogenophaga sp.]|uniref:winged helix-turn-helix domain-containing protein n=1 Tax=Hydrogenophaga sp. TaxID=1904254 RepID=UPI003D14CFFB
MSENTRVRHEEFHFNNCVIRSDTRELLKDGVAQPIERRAFDLILYLLRQDGRVASKDELLEHVWGNRCDSDSVIAQSIMKARKALGITGKEPGPIKTVHRVGYRFVGDVRRPESALHPRAPGHAPPKPVRILWLPTECDQMPPGLSWVRYGLISVATQLLQSNGVATFSVGESIQACEAAQTESSVEALSALLRVERCGLGVVHSRLVANAGEYRLEWRMTLGATHSANSVTGCSPAEMTLMAANEVLMWARLNSLQAASSAPDQHFWKELEKLILQAESLHLTDQLAPLLAPCVSAAACPIQALAELLWIQAQRADPQAPTLTRTLVERARQTEETEYAGWAELCLGLYHLHTLLPDLARQEVRKALPIVRSEAIGQFRARALLLAAQVLAAVQETEEAHALLLEAEQLIEHAPASHLACAAQRLRCELVCLGMQIAASARPFAEALAHAHRMGFQAHAAWLEAFSALRCCVEGDFDQCHRHLDAAITASEHSGATLVQIYGVLQLGNLLARQGDQGGLEQCLVRLSRATLRNAPLGAATWRWLRARYLMLANRAPEALPLAEHTLHEMADLGLWWPEDNWLFVAQVALRSGNPASARRLLARLQQKPRARHRATCLAVQGMLACYAGEPATALPFFEQAHELANQTVMAHVLLFGLAWLALAQGHSVRPELLSASGHWRDRTPAGRLVRAAAEHRVRWTTRRPYRQVLALSTGTDHGTPLVSDVCEVQDAHLSTTCLPMPV